MKTLIALLSLFFVSHAFAADPPASVVLGNVQSVV